MTKRFVPQLDRLEGRVSTSLAWFGGADALAPGFLMRIPIFNPPPEQLSSDNYRINLYKHEAAPPPLLPSGFESPVVFPPIPDLVPITPEQDRFFRRFMPELFGPDMPRFPVAPPYVPPVLAPTPPGAPPANIPPPPVCMTGLLAPICYSRGLF